MFQKDCCIRTYYLLCQKPALYLSAGKAQVTERIIKLNLAHGSDLSGSLNSLKSLKALLHLGKTRLIRLCHFQINVKLESSKNKKPKKVSSLVTVLAIYLTTRMVSLLHEDFLVITIGLTIMLSTGDQTTTNHTNNKKVLLHERKRHTARRVAIAISYYSGEGGGVP